MREVDFDEVEMFGLPSRWVESFKSTSMYIPISLSVMHIQMNHVYHFSFPFRRRGCHAAEVEILVQCGLLHMYLGI